MFCLDAVSLCMETEGRTHTTYTSSEFPVSEAKGKSAEHYCKTNKNLKSHISDRVFLYFKM